MSQVDCVREGIGAEERSSERKDRGEGKKERERESVSVKRTICLFEHSIDSS